MATKNKKAAKKPASTKRTTTTPANSGTNKSGADKEKRARKPPLERALKLANLITKKVGALGANVRRWSGEPNKEQRLATVKVQAGLAKIERVAIEVDQALTAVKNTGYEPKGGAGRVSTLLEGTRVVIKDGHYDPVIHGDINDFVYVGKTDKFLLLRPFDEPKGKNIAVRRPWIKRNEAAADAAATANSNKGNRAEDTGTDEPEDGDGDPGIQTDDDASGDTVE